VFYKTFHQKKIKTFPILDCNFTQAKSQNIFNECSCDVTRVKSHKMNFFNIFGFGSSDYYWIAQLKNRTNSLSPEELKSFNEIKKWKDKCKKRASANKYFSQQKTTKRKLTNVESSHHPLKGMAKFSPPPTTQIQLKKKRRINGPHKFEKYDDISRNNGYLPIPDPYQYGNHVVCNSNKPIIFSTSNPKK
jgi:hypothetical protein